MGSDLPAGNGQGFMSSGGKKLTCPLPLGTSQGPRSHVTPGPHKAPWLCAGHRDSQARHLGFVPATEITTSFATILIKTLIDPV